MTAKPANRRGHPAGDDLALWRRTIRDIAPLRPHGKLPEGNEPHAAVQGPSPRSPLTSAGQTPADRLSRRPEPSLGSLVGIDRANAERLKRGQHEIEARLDLHGLTQSEAHRVLAGFVARSRAAGRRCILVITGRGRLGGGVLRAAVPRWLAEPTLRRHLLGIAPAQPHHGGPGAIYLLLRRVR